MEEKVLIILQFTNTYGDADFGWFVGEKGGDHEEEAIEYLLSIGEEIEDVSIDETHTVEKELIQEVANTLPVEKIPSLKYKPTA